MHLYQSAQSWAILIMYSEESLLQQSILIWAFLKPRLERPASSTIGLLIAQSCLYQVYYWVLTSGWISCKLLTAGCLFLTQKSRFTCSGSLHDLVYRASMSSQRPFYIWIIGLYKYILSGQPVRVSDKELTNLFFLWVNQTFFIFILIAPVRITIVF